MKLTPGWRVLLHAEQRRTPEMVAFVPLDVGRAAEQVRVVRSSEDAAVLVRDLRSTPLSALSVAFLGSGEGEGNGRFLRPLAVALGALTLTGEVFTVVIEVAAEGSVEALDAILRKRDPLVLHDAKPVCFGLWALGLDPDFYNLFDTRLAAACLHLGEHHPRATGHSDESEAGAIQRAAELEADHERLLSLEGQCLHYQIPLPIPPRSTGKIPGVDARTLAARAIWILHLYAAQQADLVQHGLHSHLATIEFPFAVANARMEWRGVHVDRERCQWLREGCLRAAGHLGEELRGLGIDPPGSADAFLRRMRRLGHGEHFSSAEDRVLKAAEGIHPAARAFRVHRHYAQLAHQEWLTGTQTDENGRLHPEHRQLAAATGRNGCRNPNLTAIGSGLRPVVTAPAGRAIFELDYSQIEIGVAAAEHGDPDLIAAYNHGDVYAAAAQRFFEETLSEEERGLDSGEFRRRQPDLREQMKPFALAVMYGGGARTISRRFGISETEAEKRIGRFLSLFPRLAQGLEEETASGLARGDAAIVSGLRRRIDRSAPGGWTRNVLRNTPIQGGATVVFKRAVIDLDRAFRGTDTWLILPMHDSVVVECPAEHIEEVAERARRIMEEALHAFYPQLDPKVDVNSSAPHCWNKDGDADSLRKLPGGSEHQCVHSTSDDNRQETEQPIPRTPEIGGNVPSQTTAPSPLTKGR